MMYDKERLVDLCAFLACWTCFLLFYTGHAIFKITYHSNHDYKALYFESDAATVNEIVLKVSSTCSTVICVVCPYLHSD